MNRRDVLGIGSTATLATIAGVAMAASDPQAGGHDNHQMTAGHDHHGAGSRYADLVASTAHDRHFYYRMYYRDGVLHCGTWQRLDISNFAPRRPRLRIMSRSPWDSVGFQKSHRFFKSRTDSRTPLVRRVRVRSLRARWRALRPKCSH